MSLRVVLVRPWTDAHGGTGCCSGEPRDGICLDRRLLGHEPHPDTEVDLVAQVYRRLGEELADAEVQIVGAGNTAYLLPTVFRSVRRRRGFLAAARALNRATTAGSVLVEGEYVGDVLALGADGVVEEVRRRVAASAG